MSDLHYLTTQMRFYLHNNPDDLDDEEWAITLRELMDISKSEGNG